MELSLFLMFEAEGAPLFSLVVSLDLLGGFGDDGKDVCGFVVIVHCDKGEVGGEDVFLLE